MSSCRGSLRFCPIDARDGNVPDRVRIFYIYLSIAYHATPSGGRSITAVVAIRSVPYDAPQLAFHMAGSEEIRVVTLDLLAVYGRTYVWPAIGRTSTSCADSEEILPSARVSSA